MIRNRGLAQIPLMISLLVLAVALPVLSKVVKQSQDTRNRAAGEACVLVPPDFVASKGECSTIQGCARMVFLPEIGPDGGDTGVQFCKTDCDCPEIVGGDNVFCGECIPMVTPSVTPSATPSATLTPTVTLVPTITATPTLPCDPKACDPEYDCLLDRKCNITNIVACEKCSPLPSSTKKNTYCGGCEPTSTPVITITPTSTPSATPTTPPVVTPGECKMPIIEDYFSIKFDKMTPEVDIVFAFDTTGSMGGLIKKAKEKGLDLLDKLSEKLGDKARFAVVDFRDYPFGGYGAKGDYPYKLNVDLTKDKTKVMSGINGLTLGNGADIPESYLTVMHNVKDLKWQSGAKKILIFLGDSIEHDPEVDGSKSITMAGEIENFKKAGISLLYLNVSSETKVTDHWKKISEKIGNGSGAFGVASITTSSTDFVEIIMKLVVGVVRNIDKLYLNAKPATYSPWLKYTAMVGVTIPIEGTEIKFPYSIAPFGVSNGTYNFVVELMGDKTLYATKSASVVVVDCPESCGKLDQVCCVGEGNLYCDEGLECDLGRGICKIACPPCKAIGDYNCDGTVNGLDYSWWKQEFVDKIQHGGKWEASHDCTVVTSEDYSIWRDNYLK